MAETLVFLHGFGGTRHTWDHVIAGLDTQRYRPLALDLPGHGELRSYNRPITFAACVEEVLAAAPERFALCGYSMGGRVALHVALAAPDRVSQLVLIASSPGIDDLADRAKRRAADRQLADDLESLPFERFIERWNGQSLFAADPPEVSARAREDQRRNDPRALAAVMRAIGTGEMEPLWSRLAKLTMPVRILAGDRDAKFSALAERMRARLPAGASLAPVAGGHRLPLENPAAVALELNRAAFLHQASTVPRLQFSNYRQKE